MRRNYVLLTLCYFLLAGILAGCGGGSGSPGSQGSENTGVDMYASVIGTYNGEDTYSVDVFQAECSAGPPPIFEYFADHSARVSITAKLINPTTTFPAGNLTVEKYKIEFIRSNDSIGSPPIETDVHFETIQIPAPTGSGATTVTATILLVDLTRKKKYADDVLSGIYSYSSSCAYLNNYTAIYTFYGKNEFGKEFSFKAQMSFQIGNFDYC